MKKTIYFLYLFVSLSVCIFKLQGQSSYWGMALYSENGGGAIFKTDQNGQNLQPVYSFTPAPIGKNCYGGLCMAANGKYYGLTFNDVGYNNSGTIFEYDVNSNICKTVYCFKGTDGEQPRGSLLSASNGKLYGMTSAGGANSLGVIFEFDPLTYSYTKKIDFSLALGCSPEGSLIEGMPGVLYGMTFSGGPGSANGTFFEYDISTNIVTVKKAFNSTIPSLTASGSYPLGSPIIASNLKIYGVTQQGGANGVGTLFEYDISTNMFLTKVSFTNTNGSIPIADLVQASNGKLYGSTSSGGTNSVGVLYEYDIASSTYTKKIDLSSSIGKNSTRALMQANNGKLYGTTLFGGINNAGVIFEWDVVTNTYIKKVDFSPPSNLTGAYPESFFVQNANGKLYSLTRQGGVSGGAVLFEYDIPTNTVVKKVNFALAQKGAYPYGALMKASNGKFYGITQLGGNNDFGVIFEFDKATSAFTKKIDLNGTDGSYSYGSLIQAGNGKLYGMTYSGGATDDGVLFEYDLVTNTYTKKIDLNSTIGRHPKGSLCQASNGKLYGLTSAGGTMDYGVLFEYDIATNTYTKKIDMGSASVNGTAPQGSLIQASDGNLYGVNFTGSSSIIAGGVLFRYNYSSNTFSTVAVFNYTTGVEPSGNLVEGQPGKLFGLTSEGGTFNLGTLFEYNMLSQTLVSRIDFNGANGGTPYGTLLKASNNKLYGVTSGNGNSNVGVVFEYDPQSISFNKTADFNMSNNGLGMGVPLYTSLMEECDLPVISPPGIKGNAVICENSSQTYSVSVSGTYSYSWVIPAGWSGNSTTNIIHAIAGTQGGTIQVTASNSCGSSISTLSVVVNTCLGIYEATNSAERAVISPNPAIDRLKVKLFSGYQGAPAQRLYIINESGTLTQVAGLKRGEDETSIDISMLEAGIYLIKTETTVLGKFIKQ